ncbi:unnamed protein product [Caenorhabditis auriculariae]|uniref:Uncharacterized protein n=1 Tax=Caenorhabditis auriculariae TaxID=2777116 RepID=A0A8S1H6T2_9PELO|nr:unnamed protein product [Caenorhabditis auriculariae]
MANPYNSTFQRFQFDFRPEPQKMKNEAVAKFLPFQSARSSRQLFNFEKKTPFFKRNFFSTNESAPRRLIPRPRFEKKKKPSKIKREEREEFYDGVHYYVSANGSLVPFKRGTFLIRYSDLSESNYDDHIWLVENHVLLLKYALVSSSGHSKTYKKTNRYAAWDREKPYLYCSLDEGSVGAKDISTVEVVEIRNFPAGEFLYNEAQALKDNGRLHDSAFD